jgi:hypothetical protein
MRVLLFSPPLEVLDAEEEADEKTCRCRLPPL